MNILDFITAHTTIEYLHLEMMDIETDGVFQRLCDTIEYHPGLKRISVTNNFIHTAEQAQRFIWACRHLQGNEPKLGQRGGGDRSNPGIGPLIRSYRKGHEVDSFDTGTTVRLKSRNIPAYVHNNEERPVSWAPTLAKTTQIRSLCLDHGPYRKFWIFFPVLKMCPWLERLEIKIVELEAMVPALRECLHEACPNLSYLKVMKQEGADEPNKMIQWALGLLCPLIGQQRKIHMPLSAGSALAKFVPIPPYPIGDRLNLDMDLIYGPPPKQPHGKDGNESHCCSGFRLKSLYLQYPWMDCGTLPDIPRPINVLLDHHGPTLVELDLLGIGIALKELSQIAVRVPKLEILRAWIIWSKEHSIYLRDLLRHQKDSDLDIYNDQNDPSPHIDFSSVTTSYASLDRDSVVLTKAGLRPWNCLGLKELEISFVPTQQHLEWPQDSQILKLLLDYLMQEIARLVKLEILGFGSYVPVYHLLTLTEYNNLMDPRGSPILGCGGYLSRFKDLSSLQSVIFKQRDKLRLTVADAEWILEHWPKLNQLKFRCQFKSQEPQLAAQLLRDRKPGLQVDTKY
ncbi:hypothetical protein BGZ83_006895 [Gryganskiella cystojenkinii]|nr:hypothetical protein BGZ83_006895 [Gryganskiella cystojenkinii]